MPNHFIDVAIILVLFESAIPSSDFIFFYKPPPGLTVGFIPNNRP